MWDAALKALTDFCGEQELLDKCHPLGMFDSIATLAVASSMRELYRLVLVDTPLAPYFSESLSAGLLSLCSALHAPSVLIPGNL